ncbi:hypothetical protein FHG87_015873 [Trinorchestia longiramus]|nr:hypothetical protein FHG87_015873 [Trinorchestia longiramus]
MEKIQRIGTNITPELRNFSYKRHLQQFKLIYLEQKRLREPLMLLRTIPAQICPPGDGQLLQTGTRSVRVQFIGSSSQMLGGSVMKVQCT